VTTCESEKGRRKERAEGPKGGAACSALPLPALRRQPPGAAVWAMGHWPWPAGQGAGSLPDLAPLPPRHDLVGRRRY
jgi:hypothetical protein